MRICKPEVKQRFKPLKHAFQGLFENNNQFEEILNKSVALQNVIVL